MPRSARAPPTRSTTSCGGSGWSASSAVAWGVALVAFVVGELGPRMRLPSWLVDLSPFAHPSQLPGGSFTAPEAVVLTLVAAVLVVVGGLAYRRRDVA